jgi:hypothetical protein
MSRNSAKLAAAACVALVGGTLAINCSKGSTQNGDVKLAFVAGGETINAVTVTIKTSPAGTTVTTETVNTSDPNASAAIDIVLAPGTYTASMLATSASGDSCTGASTPFTVASGQATAVSLTLTCGTGSPSTVPGSAQITATVVSSDSCPSITSIIAAPAQTSVGSTISVSAAATDPDAADTLTFNWAPAAAFANPHAANTTFTCPAGGLETISLTVSDNHAPTACTSPASTITVNCVSISRCGNGVVESGETCDPPNGTTCSATCQTIGGAGGSTVSGAGGSTTTTGAGGSTVSGAGGSTTTGAGGSTTATGAGGSTPTGAGGSTVSGAGGSTTATGAGGSGPFAQDNAACVSCEFTGTANGVCFSTSATGAGATQANFGCDSFSGADKTNCLNLVGCLRSAACQTAIHGATSDYGETGSSFDDPHPCLCGAVSLSACLQTSTWSGVCASQYVAAAAGGSVLGLYFSTDSPIGVANNLMTCDIDSAATGSGTPSCSTASTCNVPQ